MKHSLQTVLELASAAQRLNGSYVKETATVFADDGVAMYSNYPNKLLMINTVSPTSGGTQLPLLNTNLEDRELADKIKSHFRKFMFQAIEGENDFATNVNMLLNSEEIEEKYFGYIACLPSFYIRDVQHTAVKKAARTAEGYLGQPNDWLIDLDSEILESIKSKNFDGYNVCAIINGQMASWINKTELKIGPAVIVKAKVKEHSKHWKHDNPVTRLNYVKAAQ